MVGIPKFVRNNVPKQKVMDAFQEIGHDIQACHHLKKVKTEQFSNLPTGKILKGLDPAAVNLPEGIKILTVISLSPYNRGIWKKCKKLRDIKGYTRYQSR